MPLKTNWENSGGAKEGRRLNWEEGPQTGPNVSQAGWLVRDNVEPGSSTTNREAASQAAGRAPGLPDASAVRLAPLPRNASCFVSACVSSDNSFPSVRPEPALGPWKGDACGEVSLL